MAESHRRAGTRLRGCLVVPLFSLVAAGCAAVAQSARYDALSRELALAAPPWRAAERLPEHPFDGQESLDRAAPMPALLAPPAARTPALRPLPRGPRRSMLAATLPVERRAGTDG